MNLQFKDILVVLGTLLIGACSTLSTISSTQSGTVVSIRDKNLDLPASQNLKGTSFGNYEFKAVDKDAPPFFGILPLKFKGGHLAVDIILFAPAAFFNLREVFPYYEIDTMDGVIRYKNKVTDVWTEYKPKPEESARAQNYFNANASVR
jgi:hypothetical protein